MSEEVLKALMQLFAIIAKQDGGNSVSQNAFVKSFLASQISSERIEEYYASYLELVGKVSGKEKIGPTMGDSVRTLGICKKINKTLHQKQKIVVLVRLLEFIKNENAENKSSAIEIINTVAEVFNVSDEELVSIRLLASGKITETYLGDDFITITDEAVEEHQPRLNCIHHHGFSGKVAFLFLKSYNLIFFKYLGESELFLNGLRVNPDQIFIFSPGSSLRHNKGSVFYSDIITRFLNETLENKLTFEVKIKEHRHKSGDLALNQIDLNFNNGQLVGIMGASGSGKTTLLNILSGNDKLTSGSITVNGYDLHKDKDFIKGIIGYIPQDDLLIEELTVFQNLFYNAQLCFKNHTAEDLIIKVDKILEQLGLNDVKHIKVGSPLNKLISGGQRKRLNIALELIREPDILFVDEPTSGLSSKDSVNVMDLLKEITLKGKLIFVVIHQPSSEVYKLFDNLLFLDTGGHPIYFGNPIEAIIYFKKHTSQINSEVGECSLCGSVNPELIFNLVESKEIDEFGNYTTKRKYSSKYWYELFQKNIKPNAIENVVKKTTVFSVPSKLFQLLIFLKRDCFSKFTNAQYIILNLLEVPVLALFLSLFIRHSEKDEIKTYSYYENNNIPAFFFMSIVVALLVGLTLSAEEIFKDQKILKREKFLNLSRFSYLFSKVIILFSISLVQSILFCLVGFYVLQIHENYVSSCIIVYSVFCSANLMGLILSSTFNSPVTIYIIIPLIIIPQMLLGGAMFKFSDLNELFGGSKDKVPVISNFVVSRWAYEAFIVNNYINNDYEKEFYFLNKIESDLNYKAAYLLPKLEEFQEQILSDKISPIEKKKKQEVLEYYLKTEKALFKEISGYDADEVQTSNLLDEFITLYSVRINALEKKKEKAVEVFQLKHHLTNKEFKNFEFIHTNENLTDIALNRTQKIKIFYDTISNRFTQIIDPIYKDIDDCNKILSLDAHFFSSNKHLCGKKLTTLTFNIFTIWSINLILFVVLYFNLFKKLLSINFLKSKKK